jgi:glycerol uptake facilitator-like aquaporin
LRNLWRVARQLFHEATGTFFALFALYGVLAAWRAWRYHPTPWIVAFAITYALMMGVFAFTSFRRARRIR